MYIIDFIKLVFAYSKTYLLEVWILGPSLAGTCKHLIDFDFLRPVIHRMQIWRTTWAAQGKLREVEASWATDDFSLMFWSWRMAAHVLTEDDILGASLAGRALAALKNNELHFWLKCRGDSWKGLKTKAALVKRLVVRLLPISLITTCQIFTRAINPKLSLSYSLLN